MSNRVDEGPVLLFDGVCNLCNWSVQFIIERDPEGVFSFAPLQSAAAGTLLARHGLDPDHLDSVVLVEEDRCYTGSTAALRAAAHLGGVYRLLWSLRFVPRQVRDRVYDFVAERRYDWFGRRDQCMVPGPDIEARFLGGGTGAAAERDEPTGP
ncbi:Predicted thiol-disulfide oxidoreductase YuxK, DCC family [Halovenus aranensis]|uniref:Predicted thiol-disulfide oxidoreductase YuxK, DCC family n=1 Tax=Halovenus aranensis TaxID=890420 RepID=A0A1G8XPR6_9EURY|nr:thiol-disulfide oxidoreductase DCC family protein [Halovenus aranensis]SDJ92487.1 Predicted thiol-disulfide oxidoreductase YuxK, DCC family [Halovenus aranensis]